MKAVITKLKSKVKHHELDALEVEVKIHGSDTKKKYFITDKTVIADIEHKLVPYLADKLQQEHPDKKEGDFEQDLDAEEVQQQYNISTITW